MSNLLTFDYEYENEEENAVDCNNGGVSDSDSSGCDKTKPKALNEPKRCRSEDNRSSRK